MARPHRHAQGPANAPRRHDPAPPRDPPRPRHKHPPAPDSRLIRRRDGTAATKRVIDGWLHRAQRAAGLPLKGPHVLRHTFCSRLAASRAAPRAIQELAGHRHSTTTDRYLHLTPRALQTAIDLLEARPPANPSI